MNYKGHFELMRITLQRRKELEIIVHEFVSDNALDFRNDIFRQLEKINFSVYGVKFNKPLSGMLLVDERESKVVNFKSNRVILYNNMYDIYDVRFIIAHELAHYIYEKHENKSKKLLIARRDRVLGYQDNVDEQEKDYMAAAILIPFDDIKNKIEERKEVMGENYFETVMDDEYLIQTIQREYKVPSILVKRRIEEVMEDVVIVDGE